MLAAGLSACHTSEKNFKSSYEKAVEKTRENAGNEKYLATQAERSRANTVVAGDSVRLVRVYANVVDAKNTQVKRFNVVVAEFEQIINARDYRDRLAQSEGFNCFLLYTARNKHYCVVAQTFDDLGTAAAYVKNIDRYMKMKILVPRPWILQRL